MPHTTDYSRLSLSELLDLREKTNSLRDPETAARLDHYIARRRGVETPPLPVTRKPWFRRLFG